MTPAEYLSKLKQFNDLLKFNKIRAYFPDTDQPGFGARDKYPRHMEFFAAGKDHFSRLAMCAIGTGKTESMGGYETVLHLTGEYPHWWPGHTFNRPIEAWVAGKSRETTRDIQQNKLFGPIGEWGTGLIPKHLILDITKRQNGNGAIDSAVIQHASGGKSYLGFKSYEQGEEDFYGTDKDWLWPDELVPMLVYSQMCLRTRNREGARIATTFTPMKGRTELVAMFLDQTDASRHVTFCGWDEVPHLTPEWKKNQLANTPPYLRDTISMGIPARGAGAVFPVTETKIVCEPFKVPGFWRRIMGFDGGYHHTGAVWLAWDKDNDVLYLTSEYKDGEVDLSVHAARIKMRLQVMQQISMPMIGDYSGGDTSTGKNILDLYKTQGLRIKPADKRGKDARIQRLLERMETGRFKVFKTCSQWLHEFRNYRYDEKTLQVVKTNDHLLDATMYAEGGLQYAEPQRGDAKQYVPETTFGLYAD